MTRRGRVGETAMLRTKEGRKNLRKFALNLNPELVSLLEQRGLTVEDLVLDFLEFLKNLEVKNET